MTSGRVLLGRLRIAPALALLLVCGIYPLGRLWLTPWFPGLAPPQGAAGGVGISGAAVIDSAGIGAAAALCALVPGFAFAFLLERRRWRGNAILGGLLWVLFLIPSYLLTTGWQIVMSQPALSQGLARDLFSSPVGIVALLALKGVPFACLSARLGWTSLGGEIEAAARIHVADPWRRAAIIGRLLTPVAGAAFAVVFIEAIGDFGVAATLGARLHLPLVIFEIYAKLSRSPVNFSDAARLSLVLVAMAGMAVALHRWLSRGREGRLGGHRASINTPATRLEALAASLGMALLAVVAVGVPAIALIGQAGLNPGHEAAVLSREELLSLLYSACYALISASLGLAIALGLLSLGRGGRLSSAANDLSIGGMAVPAIVLGAAYVIAFNGVLPLYGTPLLLIMGYVVSHLPVLIRFLRTPLRNAHANLSDAARVHGLGWLTRMEHIHAPILLRTLVWAWAIGFGGIFFELPLSQLLHPPGRAPLGVQLLTMDETLRFAAEARLALAGVALCLAVVGLAAGAAPAWLARSRRKSMIADGAPA